MRSISIIIPLIFPLYAFSQYSLSSGPVAGININFYSGSGLVSSSLGFGITAGGMIDVMVTPKYGLLGRVLYDDKSGSFISRDTNLQYIDNTISLAYITIDALFKYKLSERFAVHLGPSAGIPLHGTNEHILSSQTNALDTGISGNGTSSLVKEDIKNLSTRFELKSGLTYDLPLSKKIYLSIQSFFGWGLTNAKESFKWKISSWQTTLGLKFDL